MSTCPGSGMASSDSGTFVLVEVAIGFLRTFRS